MDSATHIVSDDSDDHTLGSKKRRLSQGRSHLVRSSRATRDDDNLEFGSESDAPFRSTRQKRNNGKRSVEEEADGLVNNQIDSDDSSIVYHRPKKKSQGRIHLQGKSASKKRRNWHTLYSSNSSSERPVPTRKSNRGTGGAKTAYKECQEDEEIFAEEAAPPLVSKVISIREIYQPVSKESQFYSAHSQECDICKGKGNNSNKGVSPLIYCQGCSSAVHKICLGYRSTREPMVTKVGQDHFVMQCRRCIGIAMKKDSLAPLLDTCQKCKKSGPSCAAFSTKKTSKQEEKLRAENAGEDPVTKIPSDLINNAENILFRCETCRRAWHFEHLPPLFDDSETPEDSQELRALRQEEYSEWKCKECYQTPDKVQTLIAWRPAEPLSYKADQTLEDFREDQREYLIKWADRSYSKSTWMPGAWVWGVTVRVMRTAFFGREGNNSPKWTTEEAIPNDYLRMEIIFAVKYDEYTPRSLQSDKKRINNVKRVKVKFIGLGYDETVWEGPPSSDDVELWADFEEAYDEYLKGIYFKSEPAADIMERIHAFRNKKFAELETQPSALVGEDKLFEYQKDGMNWLLYKFHDAKNVILADEMGLGKTIQMIAFMAALITKVPKVCKYDLPCLSPLIVLTVLAFPRRYSELNLPELAPRDQEMGSSCPCCSVLRWQGGSRHC